MDHYRKCRFERGSRSLNAWLFLTQVIRLAHDVMVGLVSRMMPASMIQSKGKPFVSTGYGCEIQELDTLM